MSNGIGCECFAMSEHECACDGVNWNNAPLSDEAISNLLSENHHWLQFARAIEKAHGIVEKKPLSGAI